MTSCATPASNLSDIPDGVNRTRQYPVMVEKGYLYLIEYDLLTMYDWDERVERYLALFASFDEWSKQTGNEGNPD